MGNKLTSMIERTFHHIDGGKLALFGYPDPDSAKSLRYRGNYCVRNMRQVISALSSIQDIAEKKHYSEILEILNQDYDDNWDLE